MRVQLGLPLLSEDRTAVHLRSGELGQARLDVGQEPLVAVIPAPRIGPTEGHQSRAIRGASRVAGIVGFAIGQFPQVETAQRMRGPLVHDARVPAVPRAVNDPHFPQRVQNAPCLLHAVRSWRSFDNVWATAPGPLPRPAIRLGLEPTPRTGHGSPGGNTPRGAEGVFLAARSGRYAGGSGKSAVAAVLDRPQCPPLHCPRRPDGEADRAARAEVSLTRTRARNGFSRVSG